MQHPNFAKWPSIQRLSSETVYITEKIDGTNGIIYVPPDDEQPIIAGSRERWLTSPDGEPPDKKTDNFGFGAWVHERKEALRRLGPGYHYGEFHGVGINRSYNLKDKRFASFEYWRDDISIDGVCRVPVLYEGPIDGLTNEPGLRWSIWDEWTATLREYGSVLYPGFPNPEGVVITFKNMKTARFKRLCHNDKIHKSQVPK